MKKCIMKIRQQTAVNIEMHELQTGADILDMV